MDSCFLDTSFLIAFIDEQDTHHEDARERMDEIRDGRVLISDHVFAETVELVRSRESQWKARELSKYLKKSEIDIVHLNAPGFQKAYELFQEKEAGFTDCSIAASMKMLGVENLATFDSDFEAFSEVEKVA